MVLSRCSRTVAQRAVSTTISRGAADRKTDSFAFGIMQGQVYPENMFPYPKMSEEQLETLEAMVDPFESVSHFGIS